MSGWGLASTFGMSFWDLPYWVDDKFAAQSWLFAIFGIALLVALTARRLEGSRG